MGTGNEVRTVRADDGVDLRYEVVVHDDASAADHALPIVLLHGALVGRRTFPVSTRRWHLSAV